MLRKIEAIIREEMDAMGAQEVHFPALLPKEPYDKSNRWTEYGDDVFRLTGPQGRATTCSARPTRSSSPCW